MIATFMTILSFNVLAASSYLDSHYFLASKPLLQRSYGPLLLDPMPLAVTVLTGYNDPKVHNSDSLAEKKAGLLWLKTLLKLKQ
jgi:hypothetical protein